MTQLRTALDEALSGRGQMVMMAGEPGIGKTRIAQELAAYAESLGAQTFWGWCYEQQGAPPYWPWVQPIRSYVQRTDAELLAAQMGPGAADICEIIPEVRDKLPNLEPASPLEPEQARFRLFDSITKFLKNLSQYQPLMLVLDDLQWADQPSLLLLEFLARQLSDSRILMVGTYRDVEVTRAHPLSDTLARLARGDSYHREALGGLESEQVGQLIKSVSGVEPSQQLVSAVYEHTEGNPFFMTEIIRLLEGRRQPSDEPEADGLGGLEIPQSVVEVIGQRLNRLSQDCQGILTTAAVIGRQFDFRLLGSLSDDFSETQLLESVDEALDAYLVQEIPGQGDVYQFSHALVQQTLRERLSTSRRMRLHAKIGETLETLYGDQPGDHVAELAYHFSGASSVLGPGKMVGYSLLAGERTLASYAYEEALVHFQKGLAGRGVPVTGEEPAVDAEIAALLFGVGRAQVATLPLSELPRAVVTLTRSFDYYAKEGDIDQVVAIAELPFPATAGRHSGILQIVVRALELVPPASRQIGRLLARYGWLMGMVEANYEESRDPFAQAMDIARNEGDTVLALQTLISAAEVDLFYLHHEDSLSKSLAAIELIPKNGDPLSEMLAHFYASNSFNVIGDPAEAERHIQDSVAAAERLHHHFYLARALIYACWLSHCKGEWRVARDFSDRALAASPGETRALHTRVMLEFEVGNFSDGEACLGRLLDVMRLTAPGPVYEYAFPAMVIPMAARISGDRDLFAEAQAAAENVLSSPSVTPMVAAMTNTGLALLAEQ